ncbi:YIP1 family protein [Halapricum desulfuricans]|uniref:Putative conserved membrane protein, Yip1family n=1 Tax=Halapricum desulfuricans TaxID=2841257 RepID=A0A897NTZ1_9EURY|nr:YIP1 family protein [Halapricum desulfuricans]QSG13626.1 putative conserved membrane protein, Yip1family [Halapricum desulfuricans]
MWVTHLLRDPDTFFERQANELEMRRATLVVLATAFATVLGPAYVFLQLISGTDGPLTVFYAIGGAFGVFTSALTIFVIWILFSILFFTLTRRLGSDSEFRTIFFLTGFGFLPLAFAGVASFLAIYAVFTVPEAVTSGALRAQIKAMNQHPAIQVIRVVSVGFICWRGFLWAFALKHATDVGLRRSALVAAIPTLASVVWELTHLV